MTTLTIEEVWPRDTEPVCAGCGNVVDPRFAKTTDDYKLVCAICAPRYGLGDAKASDAPCD
jgi:hypothetical protein